MAGEEKDSCCHACGTDKSICREKFRQNLVWRTLSITPSGETATLVESGNIGDCGSAECSLLLFVAAPKNAFVQVLGKSGDTGDVAQFKISEVLTNGHYDLQQTWTNGLTVTLYKWDGKRYFPEITGPMPALLPPPAQQITVKLIDGRNGQPLQHQTVGVWLGEEGVGMPTIWLNTTHDGTALLPVQHEHQSFMMAGISLVDCRAGGKHRDNGTNRAANADNGVYHFADVLSSGVVAENNCGKTTIQLVPGQMILFVRPPHWWEKVLSE